MDAFSVAFALLEIAGKIIDRSSQSGELTDAQKAVLADKATALFAKYATAPPKGPQ